MMPRKETPKPELKMMARTMMTWEMTMKIWMRTIREEMKAAMRAIKEEMMAAMSTSTEMSS